MLVTRRSFLTTLGLGTAAAGIAVAVPEPVRRYWQVPRNAPVSAARRIWDDHMEHVRAHVEMLRAMREHYEAQLFGIEPSVYPEASEWPKATLAGRLDTLNELHRAGVTWDPAETERMLDNDPGVTWWVRDGVPSADLVVAGIDHERNRITLRKA